ncbi:SigE family RNA polymerase sigma factor [Kribbella sancticallisti]|uniref:SigE family RNA polymerase sigma factor n=1 Tax=Kribbella sancticallisti TaxID=460087 RepID=A0ABP4PF96_9ACTN
MESLQDVYDGCYRRLVAQLYAFCGSLSEAEDAVQEAFVRAVEKPRRFAQVDNPEAWLRTVALNVARSRYRRATIFHGLISRAVQPQDAVPGLSPDHVALVDALNQLPWEQLEALALFHIVDLPIRDIALQLGIPEGTVKARLSRGRAHLAPLVRDFTEEIDHV